MSVNNKMLRCYIAVGVFVGVIAFPENELNFSNELFGMDDVKIDIHRVVTKDLYVLGVMRLQRANLSMTKKEFPVLLVHGLAESSDRFTEHGRNSSLAYSLTDAGFDVWLGNVRGNKYSRQHIYLKPDDPDDKKKFFNYTYEDIGVFDIPAIVNYILEHTNATKLHYVGHSQGGTAFLALNALQPEYNEKFLTAHLLAPAGYQRHFSNTLLNTLSKVADTVYKLLLELGIVEFFPLEVKQDVGRQLQLYDENEIGKCLADSSFKELCEMLNTALLLGKHRGSGGAVKQLVHYAQNVHSRLFRRWDYGAESNLQIYGTEQPPKYNLSSITVDTVLHYGLKDHLVSSWDVLEMALQMPNVQTRKVAKDDFGHADFLDAPEAHELVYDFIVNALSDLEADETTTGIPYTTESSNTRDSGSITSILNEALFIALLIFKIF